MMELLAFDSRQVPARSHPVLNEMRFKVARTPIFGPTDERIFPLSLAKLQSTLADSYVTALPTHYEQSILPNCH